MTIRLIPFLLISITYLVANGQGGSSGSKASSRAHHSSLRVNLKSNWRAVADLEPDQLTYYATIGIGSPTPQLINVLFDTSSSEIWLPEYSEAPLVDSLHYSIGGYNLNNSTSCLRLATNGEFAFDYRSSRLTTGDFYEDLFTVFEQSSGEEQAPACQHSFRQNFMAIESASDGALSGKVYDGVIGLAPTGQSSAGLRHLLLSLQLEYQRRVASQHSSVVLTSSGQHQDELVFSFWFNLNLSDTQQAGELLLGGLDERHYTGRMYFHPITRYFEWQLHIVHVHLGAKLISCPHSCSAQLDTGTSLLAGPRADVQLIADQLGARRVANSTLWFVDCLAPAANEPSLVFQIDQVRYMIGGGHLIKRLNGHNSTACYLALKAWDRANWLLGTNFMTAYHTVFDFSQRRVGFATPRQ